MLDFTVKNDPFFGLDSDSSNSERVFQHVSGGDKPAYIIETDIMNAAGLNKALGRHLSNEVLRVAWNIQHEQLSKLSPETLYSAKPAGDETTTIISGDFSVDDVSMALSAAREQFSAFISDAGLFLVRSYETI